MVLYQYQSSKTTFLPINLVYIVKTCLISWLQPIFMHMKKKQAAHFACRHAEELKVTLSGLLYLCCLCIHSASDLVSLLGRNDGPLPALL